MEKRLIVGIGEALWDILPEGAKLGGAPSNFAFHTHQFGFDAMAISALGNDVLGDQTRKELDAAELKYEMPIVPYPTGTVQVELDDEGVPTYKIKENVAWDNIPFTPEIEAAAKRACAVCFGTLAQRNDVSRATIQQFLSTTSKECLKIFDINLRQTFYTKEIIKESLQACDVLKINDEELITIGRLFGYPGLDIEDKCWLILGKYDLKMLILTCGVNGSYVFAPAAKSFVETPMVNVVDTVGAGDSFTAAFTAAILSGETIEKAHQFAVEVSAYVCTQNGATPTLPKQFTEKLVQK